ncbi:hypothetical protein WAZ07_16845 [Bacillus sp. FJAT-51639]|uniref:Lipoprotein n=1 Tax=Bacillus bruguierae TaxID=3127667 RepID=A0ABU8FJT3_9BACI
MKLKSLVGIAIPVTLLFSGCVTVKEEETAKEHETSKKQANSEDSSKDVQKIRVLDGVYAEYVLDIEKNLLKLLDYYSASVKGESAKRIACLVNGMRNTLITFNKEGAEILPISYLHSFKKYLPN